MPLETPQIRTLRLFKRAAAVYLLLLLTNAPLHPSDIAHLLDLHPQTVRQCLRLLLEHDLASRATPDGAYHLTPGGRAFLQPGEGKIASGGGIIINTTTASTVKNLNPPTAEAAVIISPADAKFSSSASEAIWQALQQAGITPNPRTRRLAGLPHLTPDYITAHFLQLKRLGKAHQTGLLITILESGVPAPPLNANRHLKDCECEACQRLRYATCWVCGEYPCVCP